MFDLKPGVHFEEIEVLVAIDDELDGPGAGVTDRLGQRAGLFAHGLAGGFVKEGRGGFLDDLLVAALDRAFAFMQIDAIAVLIGQHLNLDVAGLGDEFLDEDAVIAKAVGRLVLGAFEALARLLIVPRDAHALAAAAGAGLDHHRIADLVRDRDRLFGIGDQTHVAGNRRNTSLLRQFLRGDLVAHRLDGRRGRSDKDHALGLKRGGEIHPFGQEAIARMHSLGAGLADGVHDLVDHDIGLVGGRWPDMHGLVGHLDMQRVTVGVGIDSDGLNTHLLGGLDDAAGDLAPVGDQDFLEHCAFPKGRCRT